MGALNNELRRLSQGNSELASAVPPTRVRIRSQEPCYPPLKGNPAKTRNVSEFGLLPTV